MGGGQDRDPGREAGHGLAELDRVGDLGHRLSPFREGGFLTRMAPQGPSDNIFNDQIIRS
ncbi:hypothetical protein D3C76_1724170 [compost metagenome]